jgi:hypothetical protein
MKVGQIGILGTLQATSFVFGDTATRLTATNIQSSRRDEVFQFPFVVSWSNHERTSNFNVTNPQQG